MKKSSSNTIAAISTPLSSGAISIVRLSGEQALNVADRVFVSTKGQKPSSFTPRMMTLGTFDAGSFKEQCMCVVFKAPNSFTGEDLVEFQCHGGVTLTKGILSSLLDNGARLAEPGEFTKRAFMNGKMALSDAEGLMDVINAESEAEIRAGYALMTGELSKTAFKAQEELVDILSEIEVSFDYPEETIEYITKSNAKKRLEKLYSTISHVLNTSKAGQMIKDGVKVAIIGKPNVGKSSLLNRLAGDEKAIVTPIAGTTRDVIETSISINGLKFNLFDTAGIRDTTDTVEQIGVDKAKNVLKSADIVLFIKDNEKDTKEDLETYSLIKNTPHLTIINKADKLKDITDTKEKMYISALNGYNIDKLTKKLFSMADGDKSMSDSLIIASNRHIEALRAAKEHIGNAINAINEYTLDLITIDLKSAYEALGEITGSTTGEDIIDAIFSKFCLGK